MSKQIYLDVSIGFKSIEIYDNTHFVEMFENIELSSDCR